MVCIRNPVPQVAVGLLFTMPLDPRKIVQEARKVGLIGFAGPVTLPPPVLPKVDKRKGKRLLRGNYKARYVINKAQAIAKGYSL